ncbi:MAG TPA: hypothetical protein VH593_28900 [Ktedonobacteraceae bacterium]
MCRLTLMNRAAVTLLAPYLEELFMYLETTLGGHGNGVAGLWMDRRTTSTRKGVGFTAIQAAACAESYARRGADWILFHTRRATSSPIFDQHCHPFQARRLILAHNGHDEQFAKLGKAIGISDSECITRAWANMRFPLPALATRSGVFIGFAQDYPFVVKGQKSGDLLAGWNEETGSVLFASELPSRLLEGIFDQIVAISTIQWFGREMNRETLRVRPYCPHTTAYEWTGDPEENLPEYEEALYREVPYEDEEVVEPQRQVE